MWRFAICLVLLSSLVRAADFLDYLVLRNPKPTFNSLTKIAFGNGTFVAIEEFQTLSSPDGIDWIPGRHRTNGLSDIVFAEGQFVVVGNSGMVLTSTNGLDWTTRASMFPSNFNTITYGGGRFLAASATTLYYSDDLTNWTRSISLPSVLPHQPAVLGFGHAGFVAVPWGRDVFVSINGVSWATNQLGLVVPGAFSPSDVGYANGLYILCGSPSGVNPSILKSTNAVNWQAVTKFGGPPRTVASSATLHVIGGVYNSGGYVQISPDGEQWIPMVNTDILPRAINAIAYGNGRFVAVGDYGATFVSTNGLDWSMTSSGELRQLSGITFGHAGYVAVGGGILGSENGLDYTLRAEAGSHAIAYGNGSYVSVGGGVLESSDAMVWTQRGSGTSRNLLAIVFTNDMFMAVGAAGTIKVSTNGRAWSGRFSGTDYTLHGLTWGQSKWVAVGEAGTIVTSADGVTWLGQDAGTLANLLSITFGDGKYVAVGASGSVLTSADAVNWSRQSTPVSGDLLAVAYGRNTFVAAGVLENEFLFSTNGTNWIRRTMGRTIPFASRVAFVNDTFMFIGGPGMILQTVSGQIVLSGRQLEDGAFQITVQGGPPGAVFGLQKCSGLDGAPWQPLLEFTNAFPFVKLRDEEIDANRFYRVVNAP